MKSKMCAKFSLNFALPFPYRSSICWYAACIHIYVSYIEYTWFPYLPRPKSSFAYTSFSRFNISRFYANQWPFAFNSITYYIIIRKPPILNLWFMITKQKQFHRHSSRVACHNQCESPSKLISYVCIFVKSKFASKKITLSKYFKSYRKAETIACIQYYLYYPIHMNNFQHFDTYVI